MRHRHVAAMMNVVAIGLVLSTLAAAGVWSPAPPTPPSPSHHGDHVVREGRRLVIAEYEREVPLSTDDGGSVKVKETRVLAPDALDGVDGDGGCGGVFDEAKGAVSDAAGKVASAAEEGKERLSDATESAKGGVLGAGRKVEEGAKDAASRVEHGAEDAARRAMDAKDSAENMAFDATRKGKETVRSAMDRVSDAAHQGKEAVKSAAVDKVSDAAGRAKEKAADIQHGAAEAAKAAKEKVSSAARHARDSVSDMAQRAEECAADAAERAADAAAEAEEEAKAKAAEAGNNLTDIARRARGAAAYLVGGAPREAARTATAAMHLLGFAAAYGASVWVTFVSSHVLAAALPRQQLAVLQSNLFPVYFRAVAYGVALALAAHLLGRERASAASRAQSLNLLAALGLVVANMLLLEPKATKVMFERMKVEKEEGRGRDMVDDGVDPPVVTVATPATGAAATTTVVPTAAATARTGGTGTGGKQGKKPAAATAAGGDAEMSKSRAVALSRRLKQLNGYSSLCNVLSLMSLTWHLVHLARRLHAGTAC